MRPARPDRNAMLRLVGPDETGWSLDEVYRRYCRYVAAIVLRLGGRRGEVDDLVQDVFVEATRGLERLREPDAIKGWLATITVRVVRHRLVRRRARRLFGLDVQVDYGELVDPAASPEDRVFIASVYRTLDRLPVEDRLAFTLHNLEGEKLEEVARLCGCSPATAKRRIARAQRHIQERVSDG